MSVYQEIMKAVGEGVEIRIEPHRTTMMRGVRVTALKMHGTMQKFQQYLIDERHFRQSVDDEFPLEYALQVTRTAVR